MRLQFRCNRIDIYVKALSRLIDRWRVALL